MIGLTPAQISPFVKQRLGFAKGKKLMLKAAQINGEEAVNIGLLILLVIKVLNLKSLNEKLKLKY
ncbi:MAG: hypothetical protein CM1200mP10_32630 [Candidatus Neomarinimicrobiota bacterium]|nr:MAG: hypothetical protein CM1200mP10_32630 [Candidatus Neomarinimicrobiota bacterium]